jgi:hypothetical protein
VEKKGEIAPYLIVPLPARSTVDFLKALREIFRQPSA